MHFIAQPYLLRCVKSILLVNLLNSTLELQGLGLMFTNPKSWLDQNCYYLYLRITYINNLRLAEHLQ